VIKDCAGFWQLQRVGKGDESPVVEEHGLAVVPALYDMKRIYHRLNADHVVTPVVFFFALQERSAIIVTEDDFYT
jgi:hypothetical protein